MGLRWHPAVSARGSSPGEKHEVEPGADHGDCEDQLLDCAQLEQSQRDAAQQDDVGDVEQQLDRVVKLCGESASRRTVSQVIDWRENSSVRPLFRVRYIGEWSIE